MNRNNNQRVALVDYFCCCSILQVWLFILFLKVWVCGHLNSYPDNNSNKHKHTHDSATLFFISFQDRPGDILRFKFLIGNNSKWSINTPKLIWSRWFFHNITLLLTFTNKVLVNNLQYWTETKLPPLIHLEHLILIVTS